MPYRTVARRTDHEEVVKGSRFLAIVDAATSLEAAKALQSTARERWPDASHHCLAWRVGEEMASDDDGEPGGTAGRPMQEIVLKRGLDRVSVVCVRWFGGTKLGAGGLARAYGGTVAKALDRAGERTVHERLRVTITVPYPRIDVVHRLLDAWPDLTKGEAAYGTIDARLAVDLRADAVEDLRRTLTDRTAGDASLLPAKTEA